jgi:hypothetical protein
VVHVGILHQPVKLEDALPNEDVCEGVEEECQDDS